MKTTLDTRWLLAGALALLGGGLALGTAFAGGAPKSNPLSWSGTVTDKAGKPYSSAVDVSLAFYKQASGGTPACVAPTVKAEAGTGRFSVQLPAACAKAVHEAPDLWSQVTVGPKGTVLPRVHVGAVPYALEADNAVVAMGVQCVGCVGVDAMKFDKDVNLGGKKLAASEVKAASVTGDAITGTSVAAATVSTGPTGAKLTTGKLDLGPTTGDELTSAHVKTLTGGGNADALHTHAGNGGGSGGGGWGPNAVKFHGLTSATLKPSSSVGLGGMNAACAKQYGKSRMCAVSQLMARYPAVQPSADAWVLVDDGIVATDKQVSFFGTGASNQQHPNCKLFTSTSLSTFVLKAGGGYKSTGCNADRPVACCGL